MMRAAPFRFYGARSIAEAAAVLADEPHAMLLAGGTDVIPKLKRRQQTPELIVSLKRVNELRGIAMNGELTIGAMTTLRDIASDPRVRESHHALFRATSQIATPLIRNTATLGGNLALDTRCNYYDQSEEWRTAIGGCQKAPLWSAVATPPLSNAVPSESGGVAGCLTTQSPLPDAARWGEGQGEGTCLVRNTSPSPYPSPHAPQPPPARGEGTVLRHRAFECGGVATALQSVCWVAPSSPRCWAVSSSDAAPALIALGARVTLVSKSGERDLALEDLYRDDGIAYLAKQRDEILTTIRIAKRWHSTYWKLRRRGSIDFPVLGVAAAIRFTAGGTVEEARIVLGAVASRPLLVPESQSLVGRRLTDDVIEEFAEAAAVHAKPLDNTDFSTTWRKSVARTYLVRALREISGGIR
jgi:CO/xanthine dehydrogenase FAD-binding subunit